MYETLSTFAQTGGLLIFMILFAGVLAYALWPRNQAKFDAAANAPLTESDAPETSGQNEDEIHVR
ncbi:cbb3-type cytochrome c oxidase subunit 3 [Maricaulis alexandrii]|jgi:cytochrome c oxidase cbb3-type subunit IV|uniref:cbb3-type cytochrome c oxidase subunit 3 n=1 Tax=Maricaulis alexandrii TaxID=2570354 RepID=UPI0011098174|nr:cbb3-type cytochrome c oxidase subunit 3 [Maricaulis alexandrii]